MATTSPPPPLRWLIGTNLEHWRVKAGLSRQGAAQKIGWTTSKMNNIEQGRQIQDPDDITLLMDTYQAPPADRDRLCALSGRADDANWWGPWSQVVPDWFKTFVGLEGLAEREFVFEPIIIPGILQTEAYAQAVTANSPRVRHDYGDRVVSFRLARARRLVDEDRPLALHAVISQAALELKVGKLDLHRDQLRYLIEMAARPNVTIQVLRPADGLHMATTGQFVLLEFAEVRPLVFHEVMDGAMYLQESQQVTTHKMVSDDLRQVALGPDQSVEMLESLLSTGGSGGTDGRASLG